MLARTGCVSCGQNASAAIATPTLPIKTKTTKHPPSSAWNFPSRRYLPFSPRSAPSASSAVYLLQRAVTSYQLPFLAGGRRPPSKMVRFTWGLNLQVKPGHCSLVTVSFPQLLKQPRQHHIRKQKTIGIS